jgi:hypothetical protein
MRRYVPPTPEIEVSTAFADFQLSSVPCPHESWFAFAESCAVTGATGTVALAIPARNRGCGGMFSPALQAFVFGHLIGSGFNQQSLVPDPVPVDPAGRWGDLSYIVMRYICGRLP